jgi:hypothetical protein
MVEAAGVSVAELSADFDAQWMVKTQKSQ